MTFWKPLFSYSFISRLICLYLYLLFGVSTRSCFKLCVRSLLIISAFVAVIHLSPPALDLNNPVSPHQMLQTFNWVLLLSCFFSLTCSTLLIRSSDNRPGNGWKPKIIVNLLIILAAILIPILSGIYLFSNRTESGFLLVKVWMRHDGVI